MEKRRESLERLDRIEEALVSRIQKSDQFLPTRFNPLRRHLGKHHFSARENALRRWEASELVDHYNSVRSQYDALQDEEPGNTFQRELKTLDTLDDDVPAEGIAKLYKLHTRATGRKRFVCDFTESVLRSIDLEYPSKEQFGQLIDLEPWYHQLLTDSSATDKPASYRDYLTHFSEYSAHGGHDLVRYLMEFYDRSNAIGSGTTASDVVRNENASSETTANSLYCEYCEKSFANDNVFKFHLQGKKHQRALQSQSSREDEFRKAPIRAESLDILIDLVEPAIRSTISNIDRKSGMSAQERQLEAEAIERERELEETYQSDSDAESDDNPADKRPRSFVTTQSREAEEKPIPKWLFKLQGLGTVFHCEICGPHVRYAGRKAFEKHFRDPIHLSRLEELGIGFSPVFNGISSIREAQDLHKEQNGKHADKAKIQKEVEDDEGNVMSERMYEDLKKQGLI